MGIRSLALIALLATALGLTACAVKSDKGEKPGAFSEGHAVTQGQSGGH